MSGYSFLSHCAQRSALNKLPGNGTLNPTISGSHSLIFFEKIFSINMSMNESGTGVEQDLTTAKMLFKTAYENGYMPLFGKIITRNCLPMPLMMCVKQGRSHLCFQGATSIWLKCYPIPIALSSLAWQQPIF